MKYMLATIFALVLVMALGSNADAQSTGAKINVGPVTSVTTNSSGLATSFSVRKPNGNTVHITVPNPNNNTTTELIRSRDDWDEANGDIQNLDLKTTIVYHAAGGQNVMDSVSIAVL